MPTPYVITSEGSCSIVQGETCRIVVRGDNPKTRTALAKRICKFLNPIKISSRKGKARKLQQWAAQKIADVTGFECGKDKPIQSREMGQAGVDVRLESQVIKIFNWAVECKAQESWAVPAWIEQAKSNCSKELPNWLLIAKRANSSPIAVIDADVFFKLLRCTDLKQFTKLAKD